MIPTTEISPLEEARMNDAVVHRMLHMNMPLEAIILQLTKDKKAFVDHIVKMEQIRPLVVATNDRLARASLSRIADNDPIKSGEITGTELGQWIGCRSETAPGGSYLTK